MARHRLIPVRAGVAAPLLTLALATGGCGSGDDSGGAPAPAEQTRRSSADGQTVRVGMADMAFTPQQVTVRVGQTITWTNDDTTNHFVAIDGGPSSSELAVGERFSWTPTKAGRYDYVCTIHPSMTGTITVKG